MKMKVVELRDHRYPCEHGFKLGHHFKAAEWCDGGALRVFTYDGAGKALSTNNRGSGEFEGRKWQRWVEWINDEGTG